MLKLKIPLICAGTMGLLSVLIGFINGVRFWSILLRSITAGLITGAFIIGAKIILQIFIPELFTQQSSDVSVSMGDTVNITIEDTDLDPSEQQSASDEAVEGTVTETSKETVDIPFNTSDMAASGTPPASEMDTAKEPDTLEDLPSMDEFMSSELTVQDKSSEPDMGNSEVSGSGFSISDVQVTDTDTKVMAQAIRTVLQAGE